MGKLTGDSKKKKPSAIRHNSTRSHKQRGGLLVLPVVGVCALFNATRTVQFGCMLQRGYYPHEDGRLRGTFLLALTQDPLPAIVGAGRPSGEDVSEPGGENG